MIYKFAEGVIAIIMEQEAAYIVKLALILRQIFQLFLMLLIYGFIHLHLDESQRFIDQLENDKN